MVMRARDGDERAWAALVERYAPLIWSLSRRYRLDATDTADVGQNVWLLLVNHLGKITDPAALPGWLVTTTQRECGRVLGRAQRCGHGVAHDHYGECNGLRQRNQGEQSAVHDHLQREGGGCRKAIKRR